MEGGGIHGRPTCGSRFLRYRVMVNYPGVRLLDNTNLFVANEASNSLLLYPKVPPIFLPRPCILYRVIFART